MHKLFLIFLIALWQPMLAHSQTATFITISSGGQFDRVTIGASGCTSTTLNLCGNFTGSALSIALDGNILYVVDNKGFLYKNTLTNTGTNGNCTKLGQFISKSTAIYGLTVGNGGMVYAASGSNIEFYDPVSNAFGITGTLPNNWKIGGDLLFYKGILYEAVTVASGGNALVQVDLVNASNSILYMNFNAGTNVFGFASVTVPCSNNAAYALSTVGSSTDIYAVDMINKTQSTTATCTLPFKVNDAASIAETQSTSPPTKPIVTSPFNICQGSVVNFAMPTVGSVKDTLRWYTQAVGGTSYGSHTPAISSSTLGQFNYYVSAFDTSTGCESARDTIVVSVNPYPAVPIINPQDSVAICIGSNTTLTSSAATGNQWNFNGSALVGANNTGYTTNIAGSYTVTTTTNKGCSKTSLPTKVIISDTIKSITNLAVCQSQLPYSWNGLTFNSAGTQTKTGFKTLSGCDSTATLVLSIATAKNDTLNLFDCDSVYYKGIWYSYPTTIYDTLKAVGGCDSVNLVVNVKTFVNKIPYAYITNYNSADVSVINALTDKKITTINTGGKPFGVCTSNDGRRVFITDWLKDKVIVINTINNSIITTIGVSSAPQGIAISPDDKRVYITCSNSNKLDVIDTKTYSVVASVSTTNSPKGVCLSKDGSKVYVASYGNLQIYNAYSYVKLSQFSVPYDTWGVCLNSAGDKLYTANGNSYNLSVINTTNNTIITNISSVGGGTPLYPSISSDDKKIYLTKYQGTINIIDPLSNTVTGSINNNIINAGGAINFIKNRSVAYFADWGDNKVKVIDTKKDSLILSIPVGSGPYAFGNFIAYLPTKQKTKDTLNLSSCSSITYKSKTYTTSTSFTDTTKSYRGCDSVYTLVNININNTASKDTLIIKAGCNQVIFKGNVYTNSVVILDTTLKTKDGTCDSIYHYVSINITKVNVSNDTLSNILKHCKQIVFKSITYTSSVVVINDTIKSYQGCDSVYRYQKIIISPITVANDTLPSVLKDCKQVVFKGITYTSSVVVINDTLKSYQACDSVYSYQKIVINPIIVANDTLPNTLKHCKQVVFKGITYTSSALVINDTLKSYQGCDSVYRYQKIVISPITTKNDTLPAVLKHCKQVIFKGVTYTSSAVVINDTTKSYQGCDSVYRYQKIVINPITTTNDTLPAVLKHCKQVIFKGITYTSSTVVINDTIQSYQGCDSVYRYQKIVIKPINTATISTSYGSCDSVVFKGIAYHYSTQIIADTIKSTGGCDSIYKQAIINIFAKPTVSFTNSNVYVLANNPIVLKPIYSNAATYQWTPAIYLNDATTSYPICTPLSDTTYKLKVTSDSGCVDSNYVRVLVAKAIKIPNVFSPNGDGINDKWDIEFINTYPQSTVQIFTRAGQLLYSSFAGSYKPWNGKYNGKDLPVGVYYYIIKLTSKESVMSGSLMLIR